MARKKGTGTVWAAGEKWEGEITVGRDHLNKRIRKRASGDTPEEVFERLARLREDYQREQAEEKAREANRTPLREVNARWLAGLRLTVSDKTADRYELDASYWLPYLGSQSPMDLRPAHVEQMYARALAAGQSPHQVYKGAIGLRRVLDYAVRFDLAAKNWAELVDLPRIQREEIQPLTREQVQMLLAATAGERLAALYVLAVDSGARMGELFALTWGDWFLESREVSITKQVSERKGQLRIKETKTRSGRRRLCVTEKTALALEAHRGKVLAEGHGSQLIFPDRGGKWHRCSNFHRDYWKKALKRAGLPHIRFHDLRHTCATLLLQAGDNIKSIADRLGHSNPVMLLKVYGHVLPQMRKESARLMADVL